jgi:hypothetical protein
LPHLAGLKKDKGVCGPVAKEGSKKQMAEVDDWFLQINEHNSVSCNFGQHLPYKVWF